MALVRILTVRQPWAWAIIHGGKDVENRVRNLAGSYRGPVAIHAGKAFDDAAWDDETMGALLIDLLNRDADVVFTPGAIIGVVDLIGVHACTSHRGESDVPDCAHSGTPLAMTCSPWAEFRRGEIVHHLVLANPRPLTEPIPHTGALGLRTLPENVAGLVLSRAVNVTEPEHEVPC